MLSNFIIETGVGTVEVILMVDGKEAAKSYKYGAPLIERVSGCVDDGDVTRRYVL